METTTSQKKTREDILEAKRRASRIRHEKIKKDYKLSTLRREQQKENYAKRKREKRVVSIKEKSEADQQRQRQKWRENSRAYRKNKQPMEVLQVNIPEEVEPEWIKSSGISDKDPLHVKPSHSAMQDTKKEHAVTILSDVKVNYDRKTLQDLVSPNTRFVWEYNCSSLDVEKEFKELKPN